MINIDCIFVNQENLWTGAAVEAAKCTEITKSTKTQGWSSPQLMWVTVGEGLGRSWCRPLKEISQGGSSKRNSLKTFVWDSYMNRSKL